jgi:hypothetical protein
MLNTGFIVLEHDLYQQTVDLATGYTIPFALAHQPPFNVRFLSYLPLSPSFVSELSRSFNTVISNFIHK